MFRTWLVAIVIAIALVGTARPSWGGGGCGPVGPLLSAAPVAWPVAPVAPAASPVVRTALEWRWWPGYKAEVGLWQGSKQLGVYVFSTKEYWPIRDGQWVGVSRPPLAPPDEPCNCCGSCKCKKCKCGTNGPCCDGCTCVVAKPAPSDVLFGVDTERLGKSSEYRWRDKSISAAEAKRLVEDGLPDDGAKLRLTVIGSEADRERVLRDLSHQAIAKHRQLFVVQAYSPDQWAVKDAGFATNGTPTIYMQQPDGKVLHRQDTYKGPELLAEAMVGAIRKTNPDYDKNKDPDLNKKPTIPPISELPAWAWAAGGAAAAYFLLRRKEG